ncbi:MAG: DUF371 domain-containing protein [Nitrososphaerales archaeon]
MTTPAFRLNCASGSVLFYKISLGILCILVMGRVIERDTVVFKGHKNVLGLHEKSLEITCDPEISTRADCIIGVSADKACFQLNDNLKQYIRQGGKVRFELIVSKLRFEFSGRGSTELTLSDRREIVLRKSDFISPRTGAINCNVAASEIPRNMIENLKDPACRAILVIESSGESGAEGETFAWETLK